jgi:tungstate transport system substrate-binding protein
MWSDSIIHKASFSAIICIGLTSFSAVSSAQSIVVASTTSTEQSGLFSHLLPAFKMAAGIDVKVVAAGTGQAVDMGRRGDADIVFVHDQLAEEAFVAAGFGIKRMPVMYNDFVLIGPAADPAKIKGVSVFEALRRLAATQAAFVSRGDKSGTHAAELRYWKQAGVESPKSAAYKECGCGMGQALNMAAASGMHVLADRGTWLAFKNRQSLGILVQGDSALFNQYGVVVVNPAKHPHVKFAEAQRFADWIVSGPGQKAIAAYKINGEQLFFPNASTR